MAKSLDVQDQFQASNLTSAAAKRHGLGMALFFGLSLSLLGESQVSAEEKVLVRLSPRVTESTIISPSDVTKKISVVLVLPLKDVRGAQAFAEHVSKPGDPIYGQYLTPEQFASAYGASESDYVELKNWANASGLTIAEESTSRTTLTVRGTVGQFGRLFHTQINNYRSPQAEEFYAASTEPIIPSAIAAKVMGVVGLSGGLEKAPLARIYKKFGETPPEFSPDITGGSGPGGAYNAADLRSAYFIPSLGGVAPQSVGVFEQGGFFASDIQKYLANNNLPSVPVKARPVDGSTNIVTDPNVELEAVLDIDMIIGINPAVKEVLVYEDGIDPFGVALLDALADVASDNRVQTLSISYGDDEVQQGNTQIAAEGQLFTQLAAQGITVFVSAGDQGAYGRTGNGLNASDPGAQPYVTSVGGTTLFLGQNSSWLYETVWNTLGYSSGATGGGVSAYWAIPAWQLPTPLETRNGGSATNRNFPDVAAVGDPYTGVSVYSKVNGGWVQVGGTSVSAPIWAGMISQLNSATETVGQGRLGFVNPKLYFFGGAGANAFIDIADGTNGNAPLYNGIPGYNAGIGYDNCSGWGSIFGQTLVGFVLLNPGGTGNPPAAFGGLTGTAGSTTAKISWSAAKGATGYLVQVVAVVLGPTLLNFVSKDTQVEISGLTPKTDYFINVGALNRSGSTAIDSGIYLRTGK